MFCKTLVLVLGLLACTHGSTVPIGLNSEGPDGRIVGGSATTIQEYPWQVSLQRWGSHLCGGSLISRNIVLTAAHCLRAPGVSTTSLEVRAGSSYKTRDGVLVQVSAFQVHSGYDSSYRMNDIGVVRLKTMLVLGKTIKLIPLARDTPKHGAAATVSGWGRTSYNGVSAYQLRYVNTHIVGRQQCASSSYRYGSQIRATMFCAASKDKDACHGDSGGPLVSGGELVGVVSWGNGCAQAAYPGVYANVAELRSWILRAAATT